MNATLQSRISPPKVQAPRKISDAKMAEATEAVDSNGGIAKVDFKSVLTNSNDDMVKERMAKSGSDLSSAKSYEDFLQNLNETTNKQRTPKSDLGKDDFLRLFITQLQNQDPLKPKDGAEMASQLAQFNSVEQMMNVNKGLERLEKAQTSGQSMNYINYIGKEVSVKGGRVRLNEGGIGDVKFEVNKDMVSSQLEVRDTGGTLVATKELGTISKGSHQLGWDGLGKDGARLANANYSFSIAGKEVGGEDVAAEITTKVQITGVDMADEGSSEFYTTLGKLKPTDIAAIGEKGFAAESDKVKQENSETKIKTEAAKKESAKQAAVAQSVDKAKLGAQGAAAQTIVQPSQQPAAGSPQDPAQQATQKAGPAVSAKAKNQQQAVPAQPFSPTMPSTVGYEKASEPNPA